MTEPKNISELERSDRFRASLERSRGRQLRARIDEALERFDRAGEASIAEVAASLDLSRWRATHAILRTARTLERLSPWLAHQLIRLSLYIPPPWISPWRPGNDT